jgi:hypothetical protein
VGVIGHRSELERVKAAVGGGVVDGVHRDEPLSLGGKRDDSDNASP